MKEITISANDAGQRLDRFLKKYLANAPLSAVYKLIRKDIKVDGRRRREDYCLSEGEALQIFASDAEIEEWSRKKPRAKAKRQFKTVYEDDDIIIVSKPFGLLVHGDRSEKKDTLTNQVTDYLIETGAYDPRAEKSFVPSPAHRLDRNTTGLVVFGKNAEALRQLAKIFREDGKVSKYYYAIVHGRLDEGPVRLRGKLLKDEKTNTCRVLPESDERGRYIETVVSCAAAGEGAYGKGRNARGYSLADVELVTGRSHQIRAHLSSIGHPLAGDIKYGGKKTRLAESSMELGASTQALHAYKIEFKEAEGVLGHLRGRSFTAPLPQSWDALQTELLGRKVI
ncbi:MAG: RluA family pseudouridine synthase [Firmicutes bacterium]|nr:RluA family pseudouridine synthase [Bacillota bacterium]